MIKYTVIVHEDGTKQWWFNVERHREDGPATERTCGTKEWWVNGKRHRLDGPAIEYSDGDKEWWFNDGLHREDGPAIERSDGTKSWWVNDKKVTEKEHKKLTSKGNCSGKIVGIDGIKYKPQEI